LPYRISICGLDELAGHAQTGFSHVLSILDPDWPDPSDFAHYRSHRRTVFRFHDISEARPGLIAPTEQDVAAILDLGSAVLAEAPDHLLIHCHAGISRSTATAVILMTQANPAREQEAFIELARTRPRSWPNGLMIEIADHLLRRGGALIAAFRVHRRSMADLYPDFAELLSPAEMAPTLAEP
jgi:predicted protein tyrosine phosphatase